ncbi:MAG: nuclear transport factor 2 family protein, partial [Actinomycetota bacterium]|nr:nuclear transport factor 2 family protein [Actinomycetota bacterium]
GRPPLEPLWRGLNHAGAVDIGLPDGSAFDCRVTAVARREGEVWRLVHAHFSVGVPDEEVVELQKKWSQSP